MRCVLYLRMSTDEQDHSIADQRGSLQEYAAKAGYQIVREYIDEGISGDATEKRLAFQRMIADCSCKSFETVLAWDQDRFGRFDPLEAGFWIKPMRDAGVVLETVAQGRVDWNDFAGRIVWSVTQEAKHAFLRDLAGNCLRGNIARAKAGLSTGRVPYGYLRVDGRYVLGDPEQVSTIRKIFKLKLSGLGNWLIACKLNETSLPSPSGKSAWTKESVRLILMREAYTGTLVFGKLHSGKYKSMKDGAVGPGRKGKSTSPIRHENAHPAIVSKQDWQSVQSMVQKPHARVTEGGAPLAGLLYCGLCDCPMYSMSVSRTRGKVIAPATYRCSTYHTGRGCGHCAIQQQVIHQQVSERIKNGIRGSCATEEELACLIEAEQLLTSPLDPVPVRKRLADIDRAITEASSRMLTINKRLLPGLEKHLLQMHDQRDSLAAELEAMVAHPSRDAREIASDLWSLSHLVEEAEPSVTRQTLKGMFAKIIAIFEPAGENRRGKLFRFKGFKMLDRLSSKEWPSSYGNTPFWASYLATCNATPNPAVLRKGQS